ncbi:MAG: uroporphyrinogen-III synthase [Thermomicrobiales bacterium]|nr:uroporphyrinogen-III synthase [Thermomicrobiales bacterium]MCO5221719.1 uroporphyrinogen-III synthase [Thermomicrobiales bacterium]
MSALEGLRIVNTRAVQQAGELNDLLRKQGAIPLSYPCIAIAPVSKIGDFDAALERGSFDWICLTSQNAVDILASRAEAIGLDRAVLVAPRYAVVGAATAATLKRLLDIDASFVPEVFDATTMMRDCPIEAGERVLMPVSDLASDEPAVFLTEKGVDVTRMIVYHTVLGRGGVDAGTLLKDGLVDAITFTSPSAVSGFVKRLKREEGNLDDARQVPIACIGPSTRNRAISENMLRAFMPAEHTLNGLLGALTDVVTSQQQGGRRWG